MSYASRFAMITSFAAPFALLAFASPAAAQDQGGDRVNMVIAYDEDDCPEPTIEGELVVCQIVVEAERYRIPSNLRQSDSPENNARSLEVQSIRYISDFGAMSCTPTGAGGFTGCTQQFIDQAYAERAEGENIRFSQLIEEARQERLSTIDGDAAAEQGRVEQIEREYLDRLERERSQTLPGEEALPAAAPGAAPADPTPAPETPAVGPVEEPAA